MVEAVRRNAAVLRYAAEAVRRDEAVVTALEETAEVETPSARQDRLLSQHCGDKSMLYQKLYRGAGRIELDDRCRPRFEDDWVFVDVFYSSTPILFEHAETDSVLRFASLQLRADEAVVMQAIYQNPTALQYAAEPLRDDALVVERAVTRARALHKHETAYGRDGWKVDPKLFQWTKWWEVKRYASVKWRKRERHRTIRGRVTGRQTTLPVCDGGYRCVLCHAVKKRVVGRNAKQPRKGVDPCNQLKLHVRQHHRDGPDPRFRGYRQNAKGQWQYGACVCGRGAQCKYTGPTSTGQTWVRHPDARQWQDDLHRTFRDSFGKSPKPVGGRAEAACADADVMDTDPPMLPSPARGDAQPGGFMHRVGCTCDDEDCDGRVGAFDWLPAPPAGRFY